MLKKPCNEIAEIPLYVPSHLSFPLTPLPPHYLTESAAGLMAGMGSCNLGMAQERVLLLGFHPSCQRDTRGSAFF